MTDDLERSLGRIEGKLDALMVLPDRVASLERWRAWTLGGAAALSGIVAAAWAILLAVVFHGK